MPKKEEWKRQQQKAVPDRLTAQQTSQKGTGGWAMAHGRMSKQNEAIKWTAKVEVPLTKKAAKNRSDEKETETRWRSAKLEHSGSKNLTPATGSGVARWAAAHILTGTTRSSNTQPPTTSATSSSRHNQPATSSPRHGPEEAPGGDGEGMGSPCRSLSWRPGFRKRRHLSRVGTAKRDCFFRKSRDIF